MGMKALYILRHGKASWATQDTQDSDRSLTPRGRQDATKIGIYCAENSLVPSIALVSTAQRTRETFDHFCQGLVKAGTPVPEVHFEPGLYLATTKQIYEHLSALPPTTSSTLIIGHNPGLHEFVMRHSVDGAATDLERTHADFPTAALAAFNFDSESWEDIDTARGQLNNLVFPKDIDQS
ncbi:MAG: phosphohistidine phosphatase [Alphaproteobacteria bacterium]|jgi:phosphohistidine phosphatase